MGNRILHNFCESEATYGLGVICKPGHRKERNMHVSVCFYFAASFPFPPLCSHTEALTGSLLCN